MLRLFLIVTAIAVALPAMALDGQLSRGLAAKSVLQATPPPPDADVLRQGGDTIADAVFVTLPVEITGTTVGYTDDYDEVCPYTGSISPDVVYSLMLPTTDWVTIDLYGSAYDTKVYVYDENLNLIICNDDYYSDYTSKLFVELAGGVTHYVVIDGFGGDSGEYSLTIAAGWEPCTLVTPPGAMEEGEPPLVDGTGILDCHNGGCQFVDECSESTWQFLGGDFTGDLVFHGVSGWYHDGGANLRDTDWFEVVFGSTGMIEIEADAEQPSYLFELGPQDCATVGILQIVSIGACLPGTMTITGEVGTVAWIWVGPQTFGSPTGVTPYEFDYLLWLTGLESGPVAVEAASWTDVKSLYR